MAQPTKFKIKRSDSADAGKTDLPISSPSAISSDHIHSTVNRQTQLPSPPSSPKQRRNALATFTTADLIALSRRPVPVPGPVTVPEVVTAAKASNQAGRHPSGTPQKISHHSLKTPSKQPSEGSEIDQSNASSSSLLFSAATATLPSFSSAGASSSSTSSAESKATAQNHALGLKSQQQIISALQTRIISLQLALHAHSKRENRQFARLAVLEEQAAASAAAAITSRDNTTIRVERDDRKERKEREERIASIERENERLKSRLEELKHRILKCVMAEEECAGRGRMPVEQESPDQEKHEQRTEKCKNIATSEAAVPEATTIERETEVESAIEIESLREANRRKRLSSRHVLEKYITTQVPDLDDQPTQAGIEEAWMCDAEERLGGKLGAAGSECDEGTEFDAGVEFMGDHDDDSFSDAETRVDDDFDDEGSDGVGGCLSRGGKGRWLLGRIRGVGRWVLRFKMVRGGCEKGEDRQQQQQQQQKSKEKSITADTDGEGVVGLKMRMMKLLGGKR